MRSTLVSLSVLALAACNIAGAKEGADEGGGGKMTQRSYQVGDFSSIGLGGHHNVVVTVGQAASVRAEGPPEELDRLDIRVEDGDLKIGSKKEGGLNLSFRRNSRPVTVYVTAPALTAAAIGGSGNIKIDKAEGDKFAAAIGGSGDIEIGRLQVREANFAIGGSGGIRASGTSGKTSISVAGSGDVDLSRLQSRSASISVVGSGDVQAHAADTAEVSIMGSGNVTMSGQARCSIKKRGSGNVRCGA